MNISAPRTQRMTTGIERVFRAEPPRPGIVGECYREILLHWIYFLDPDTGETTGMKLDKQIVGGLYKIVTGNERSFHGEVEYTFPNGQKHRLVRLPDALR